MCVIMRELKLTHGGGSQRGWDPNPIIDPDFKSKPMLTTEQFFDKLCKRVGSYYGLADIRDAE